MSALRAARRWWCTHSSRAPHQRMLHTSSRWQNEAAAGNGDASTLPEYAEVVVVGGGAVGTSLAYHLAKMSHLQRPSSAPPSVVLLEKTELTAGSTWHAAGLTATYHFGMNMRRVHYDSMQLYTHLEKETGQAIGLHRCGSLRLAERPERMDEFRLQLSKASWYPAPIRLVDVDEMKELCPLINTDGLLGGLHNPYDGHVDPYSVTMAMGAGARMYGAKVVTNAQVSEMEALSSDATNDARWKVSTNRGTILCRDVVNASGFWGREVDELIRHRRHGYEWKLPLIPVHHQYCVTDTVPEVAELRKKKKEIPVMRDLDGSYYFRMERDGLLVGPYESPDRMKMEESWLLDKVTPGFGKELFESDIERIAPYLEAAVKRFPTFGKAPITRTVAGPITYAPDGHPMVGPKPGYPGMWLAVGFGYGIIHAGGIGRYMAQWIRSGAPPYDLTECDPGRYGSWSDDPRYIMEKTRESYGMNNALGFVKEERPGGRPSSRIGHFYTTLQERGARFGFKAGFEVPLWFERPGDETGYRPSFHRTNWFEPVGRESKLVREKVGVIDLCSFATFTVRGKYVEPFLSYVFANKIPKVKGRSCLAHLLTPTGRVMSEMMVTCLQSDGKRGTEFMLTTGGGSELHDLRWLEEQATKYPSVSIDNTTDTLGCLGVAGPNSAKLMERLFPAGEFTGNSWPLLSHRKLSIAGASTGTADVIRVSYTGELGWEIHCPVASVPELHAAIHKMGADLGVDDFGMYAMNSLRIEKGFRAWGAELSKDNTIVEAGMMAFVRNPDETSPYIGDAAVSEELQMGSKEKLVMLQLLDDNGRTDPDGAEAVYCKGTLVGHVSSGCYGYEVGSGLAFAYVTPFVADEGLELEIDLIGQRRPCKVIAAPVPAFHLRK